MIWESNLKYLNNEKCNYRKCFAIAGLYDF